jgi:ribosomal protein L12E/L44/L45/RPP1/RPP2
MASARHYGTTVGRAWIFFFVNALEKNSVDRLEILSQEKFAKVSVAAEKGMSRNSISF